TQGGRVRDGRSSEKWSRIFTRDIWHRLSAERDYSAVQNPGFNEVAGKLRVSRSERSFAHGGHTEDRPHPARLSLGLSMGTAQSAHPGTRTQSSRRTSAASRPGLPGRDSVCPCYRLPMGKVAKVLPLAQHLLAAV